MEMEEEDREQTEPLSVDEVDAEFPRNLTAETSQLILIPVESLLSHTPHATSPTLNFLPHVLLNGSNHPLSLSHVGNDNMNG